MANMHMAPSSRTLFPILQAPVGLARMAAEATHTADGHLIEFRALKSRSILNRTVSKRMGWSANSINPYRGCEFGCKYCYARYTHEFLQPAPIAAPPRGTYDVPQQPWALAFEREIYVKENAAWLLEQELKRVDLREEIAIGTATDSYQPIERKAKITRSMLEVLARYRGLRVGIVTKSTLIARDIDLLQIIAERSHLVVHITITTMNIALARKLEPRAPRPDLRMETVRKLREAGITAGVLCSPLLPGINDSERAVERVAKAAALAGANFFAAHPLFLKACSRPTYLSFVRAEFPHLAADYAKRYERLDFAGPEYTKQTQEMVARLCTKYGLARRSLDAVLTRGYGEEERKPPLRYGEMPEKFEAQAKLFA